MIDRIKDYFAFTKKEQRGLIVLLGLMLLSILINIFLPWLVPEKEFDITPFKNEVEQFLASVESADSLEKQNNFNNYKPNDLNEHTVLQAFINSPFYFDPNKLTSDDWKAMGMDDRIAGNIVRYREKGGEFRDKEGFKKIYGMTGEIFSILEPYLKFEAKETKSRFPNSDSSYFADHSYKKEKVEIPETVLVELNSTDSVILLTLNGIGPSFAGRIIRYRDRLGGFYKPEQLLEIKGMDSLRYNGIRDQISTDPALISQMDLNSVAFKEMLKHPYFEYYLVKAIFQKKDELKGFDSVGQIKSLSVMYEELYDKISHYLKVN